jgi:hypothetical protein
MFYCLGVCIEFEQVVTVFVRMFQLTIDESYEVGEIHSVMMGGGVLINFLSNGCNWTREEV